MLAGPMSCRLVSVAVNVNSDLRKQSLPGRNCKFALSKVNVKS